MKTGAGSKFLFKLQPVTQSMSKLKKSASATPIPIGPGEGILANRKIGTGEVRPNWIYREEPDGIGDSGWRVLTGFESDDEMATGSIFAFFSRTVIEHLFPELKPLFENPIGSAFERNLDTNEWDVSDFDPIQEEF